MNKEELVLVVSRKNVTEQLIEPLQTIIQTLRMAAPFSLYTSDGIKISALDLYSSLVEALSSSANSSLSHTLRLILKQREQNNFRVCILGGTQVNWDIVLEYKRRKILIDTAGMSDVLSQVSHTTGGISRIVAPANIIKTFLTDFSMPTAIRRFYLLQENSVVKFHLQPTCCLQKPLSSQFYACSACMHIYCPEHSAEIKKCYNCGFEFDPDFQLKTKQSLECPLKNEDVQKKKEKAQEKNNQSL